MLHTTWQQAARFRPVPREPLVPQIVDQLRQHIVLGALREHDRLPPLSKLAELFGVSVPTVRSAIAVLSYLGVLRVSHGVGVFVRHDRSSHRATIAGLQRAQPEELIELRGLLEVRAAKLMAIEMRKNEVNEAYADLHFAALDCRMRHEALPESFVARDLDYHRAILMGAGSAYAISLHAELCQRLTPQLLADGSRQSSDRNLAEEHWDLLVAIQEGRAQRAAILAARIAAAEAPPPAASAPRRR